MEFAKQDELHVADPTEGLAGCGNIIPRAQFVSQGPKSVGLTSSDFMANFRQNRRDLADNLTPQIQWQRRPKVAWIRVHGL
jgi:hypothetical protein